jgi:hypothetical protein
VFGMSYNSQFKIAILPSINKIQDAKYLYSKVLGWEKTDNVLYGACSQYPLNNDPDSVAFKIELVDSLYKCNLMMGKPKIIHDIVNKKLDLVNGNKISNVDNIAKYKPGHKRVGWVFASKYCHFHVPLKYPILDSFAKKGLKHIMDKATLVRYDSYSNFVSDLDLVISKIGGNVSYKEMDIYLYLLGQYLDYSKGRIKISSNIKAVFNNMSLSKYVKNLIP